MSIISIFLDRPDEGKPGGGVPPGECQRLVGFVVFTSGVGADWGLLLGLGLALELGLGFGLKSWLNWIAFRHKFRPHF